MRQNLLVDIPGKKKLHVTADIANGATAVVIVHGLGSYIHEALYEDARRYFNKKGLSVFRPYLYSWEDDARDLKDCTLETHGKDLDTLVHFLRTKGYSAIHMVGHSYGGPSIQGMSAHITSAVMWDGTYTGMSLSFLDDMTPIQELGISVNTLGIGFLLGDEMVKEARRLFSAGGLRISCAAPTKYLYAGDGILFQYRDRQRKAHIENGSICSSSVIAGADHNFTSDKVKDKLFKATYNWIKKYN